MSQTPEGITVEEYEDLLCEFCNNSLIVYFCPACDKKVCNECFSKAFKLHKGTGVECYNCTNFDKGFKGYLGPVLKT